MTPEQVIAFLDQQRSQSTSGLNQHYAAFADLYDRKLWNQLTKKIEEFIKDGSFSQGNELIRLYENFVVDFEQKINKLSLVHIALSAAKQFPAPQESIAFLQSVATKVQSHPEAFVMTVMETAAYQLATGDLAACKKAIEESEKVLDSLPGVEPIIHASFYRVYAGFDQARFNYVGFYKNSLLYLACVSLESIPLEQKIQRTYDLGLAALLGESIYNFGDLLGHDIINVLVGTKFEWLIEVLKAFNRGDIAAFERLQPQITTEGLLVASLPFLQQKIRLMALIEVIFHLSADKRSLSFELIAEGTQLPLDQVEHLLMKAMSLKLIKGVIDQVDEIINVSWVQPRILDKNQIAGLKTRLEDWNQEVAKTISDIETETPELFA